MRRWRGGQVWRLPVSGRAFIHRFGFAILLTIAFTLMVMGQAENAIAERLRTAVTDALAPVLGALSRPVESVQGMIREVGHLFALRDENARLRGDNERLRRWETVARRLETENAALRGLLNFKPDPTGAFVSARVVGDSGSAFIRAMLLNAGGASGIGKGHAVITGKGLVGRIIEVGQRSSRVLLLTDLNSRIPVVVEETRQRAILAGDNSPNPYLALLAEKARVEVGARIITSGHGGQLPLGLPIGVVSEVGESGIRVNPFVDLARLEYVRVVNWSLPRFSPLLKPGAAPAPIKEQGAAEQGLPAPTPAPAAAPVLNQ